MTSKFDIQPGTILEDFEAVSGWSITGGTAFDDTTFVKTGTKSMQLVAGAGGNCIATKTVNLDMSVQGSPYIELYIPTLVGFTSLQIIFANDSGFANFFSRSITALVHEGWTRLPLPRDAWVVGAGTPTWDSPMVRLRVRINGTEGTVMYYDSLVIKYQGRPKVVLSFDDGWGTQYTEGFAYMKKFGFKGSLFLIKDRIDTTNYMTTAQVQDLFDHNWDVMNHTVSHPNMAVDLSTQAQVEAELTGCRDWIIAKGWSRFHGENHVAYPNGGYDAKVLAAMAALDMVTGRTTLNRNQLHEIDNQYLLVRQSHAYTASAATYQGYVDSVIRDGGYTQINYHKIVADGTGAADTEVEQAQFRGFIDYLDSRRNELDVITYSEWYRGLTEARRLV